MTPASDTVTYRHAGALLVRASTYPEGLRLPDPPIPSVLAEDAGGKGRAWLAGVWRHEQVREVVQAASPVLFQRIADALAGRLDARSIQRLVRSLTLYLLRWRGRATPFGLFAGVAPVHIGRQAMVRWTDTHRVAVRADALWLDAVIARLEQHPGLRERLPVVVDHSASVRGEWLIVAGQPPESRSGVFAPREIAVRRTGPVRTAVAAAREPVVFADLVKRLAAEYPAVAVEQIRVMLAGLVARRVLLTSLRAPLSVPDALAHLQTNVETMDVVDLPEVANLVGELRAIHADVVRHNATDVSDAETIRVGMAERMRELCATSVQPLMFDLAVGCDITIPDVVIAEAEAAAGTLLRLTPYPFGYPHWKEIHSRFRRRYGPGAVVTVRDLLADSGLGLPAGYLGSSIRPAARALTPRDDTLTALVQNATVDGSEEIVLSERLFRALAVDADGDLVAPPRVELAFQVHAASLDDLQHGRFRLVVTGVPRPASSMAGRFTDLLPPAERARWADTYRTDIGEDAGTIIAQLCFPPRQRRDENVIRTPQLLPHVVSLAEHRGPGAGRIDLDDLAVYADARHMHLIQLSTGKLVETRVLHALEGGVHTPPLARFLAEVSGARRAAYTAFDWGAAARLPYLPRLRSGRTVLSPARWLLHATDLPPASVTLTDWDTAFAVWRQRRRVPATVAMCEADLRLPLDVNEPAHRALLRAHLDRAGFLELREAPAPADLAWLGRVHEILLPLHAAGGHPGTREWRQWAGGKLPVVARDAAELPGRSPCLYARIYGHPERQNAILTEYGTQLFDGWDDARLWWFNRHRDQAQPGSIQHLDVYIRLHTAVRYGQAAARLANWAADLREGGLVAELALATYQPQTGRYGHGAAMTAAEEVFAADSLAALAEIRYAAEVGDSPDAVTGASLVELATSYISTPTEGLRWLIEHLPRGRGALDRSIREEALRLADPGHPWATVHAQHGTRLVAAWQQRRVALAAYRDQLAHQRDPRPVLRSLLHQHHVRAIGVDSDRERLTHRLARTAALRQMAQHAGDTQ